MIINAAGPRNVYTREVKWMDGLPPEDTPTRVPEPIAALQGFGGSNACRRLHPTLGFSADRFRWFVEEGRGSGPHALRCLEFGPLHVSIGPVIGPVNPGMFRHVLPASTADRTSYQ